MASKIDPYKHLLGKVDDEKIAEMAGVKPATVTAYRRDLEAQAGEGSDAGEGAGDADGDEPTTGEAQATSEAGGEADAAAARDTDDDEPTTEHAEAAEAAEVAAEDLQPRDDETLKAWSERVGRNATTFKKAMELLQQATTAARAAAVAEEMAEDGPVPRCVRVRVREQVLDEEGRPWRLRRFDVFRGEQAAWLWKHHRNLVEPFPRA